MQSPREGESLGRLRRRLVYHLSQLKAESGFEDLVPSAQEMRAALDDFDKGRRSGQDAISELIALRDRRDRRADNALDELDLDLLKLVKRDRKDVRYVQPYGDKNLSTLKRLPFDDEAKALRHIADTLDDDKSGLTSLKAAHQAGLRAAAAGLEEANKALTEALEGRARRSVSQTLLTLNLKRLLEKNYAAILHVHPHDKKEVELYFYAFTTASKKLDQDL